MGRLASDLTLAEQHVREELARTLHDGLQQPLFSVGIAMTRMGSTSQADQVGLLQRARDDINEAMEATRSLSVNLFPPCCKLVVCLTPWHGWRNGQMSNTASS